MKHKILAVVTALTLAASANFAFAKGDAGAGKSKAAACAGCHGPKGISLTPMYPNLAGQKGAYIAKQLKAFKDGVRKEPTMKAMTAPLSAADMDNLGAYYESLK